MKRIGNFSVLQFREDDKEIERSPAIYLQARTLRHTQPLKKRFCCEEW
jgi:hypothetical protein